MCDIEQYGVSSEDVHETGSSLSGSVEIPGTCWKSLEEVIAILPRGGEEYRVRSWSQVVAVNQTFGSAWLRPTVVQGGRLLKFGVQIQC